MTFDEVRKLIKKGDVIVIRLREELRNGLSPNLASRNFTNEF